MKISGIKRETLHRIAEELDLEIVSHETGKRVIWINFKIKPRVGSDKYRRIYETVWAYKNDVKIQTKKTGACCHHAFYDLLNKVFQVNKKARARSSVANFDSADEFYSKIDRNKDYWGLYSGNVRTTPYFERKSYCKCEEIKKERDLAESVLIEKYQKELEEPLYD